MYSSISVVITSAKYCSASSLWWDTVIYIRGYIIQYGTQPDQSGLLYNSIELPNTTSVSQYISV